MKETEDAIKVGLKKLDLDGFKARYLEKGKEMDLTNIKEALRTTAEAMRLQLVTNSSSWLQSAIKEAKAEGRAEGRKDAITQVKLIFGYDLLYGERLKNKITWKDLAKLDEELKAQENKKEKNENAEKM